MPKAKRVKSTVEPNTEPNRRTKKNKGTKLDTELNTALSLVKKDDSKDNKGIQHQGTKNLLAYHAKNKEVDLTEVRKVSIDKHVENTRFKVAYVVDQLADELIREASKKTKKDKEHLKGITWAFGTLYDKLANVSTDAQVVSLPSKLLANVTEMIKAQTELIKAAQSDVRSSSKGQEPTGRKPIVVNPTTNDIRSDTERSDTLRSDTVSTNDIRSATNRTSDTEKLRT